jgi:signal peptidase I
LEPGEPCDGGDGDDPASEAASALALECSPAEVVGGAPLFAVEEPASAELALDAPPPVARTRRAVSTAGGRASAAAAELRRRRPAATALQLGAFALLAYLCLFNFSVVRGSSMAPRIHDGDRILIDHWSYLLSPVQRGDIVVLKYPLDPSVDYIKRVIGLPGDRVVLEDGKVYVNGTELAEPYVQAPDSLADLTVEVLPAHYFVLGDNRRRSCDSREFGQVPCDYVRGKVEVRVWPPQRLGRIDA